MGSKADIFGVTTTWWPLAQGTRRWVILAGLVSIGLTAPLGSATVALALLLFMIPLLYHEAKVNGTGRLAPFGSLGLPAAALVGAALISSLFADDVLHSFGHVAGLAVMAAVGLISARIVVRERAFFLKVVMPVAVVTTAFSASYALYEYFVLDVRRATALLSHTNRLATLLVFFGILAAGFLLTRRNRTSWLLLPFGLLVLGGLGATMSRAGWVAAAVGLGLLGLRGGKRYVVVFLVALLIFGVVISMDDTWSARFQSIYNVQTNQDRLTLWSAALNIFRDHPVVGAGPGSFLYLGESYIAPDRYRQHATPHNVVLNIASDMGLAGLLAFLWLLGRAGQAALYLWRRGGAFYVGLVAAVASIFVNDLFGQGFYTTQTGTVMWFGLGLLAAFYEMERASADGDTGEAV